MVLFPFALLFLLEHNLHARVLRAAAPADYNGVIYRLEVAVNKRLHAFPDAPVAGDLSGGFRSFHLHRRTFVSSGERNDPHRIIGAAVVGPPKSSQDGNHVAELLVEVIVCLLFCTWRERSHFYIERSVARSSHLSPSPPLLPSKTAAQKTAAR
ncbi:hypothetical protein AXF42_Ash002182 [Apostasia shenzhenica]|uniref:Secreted protein n=1 Tax=Apostasia shenzhenica TaxID=1088818 RepID=A0A2I0AMT6_9ASPA|nr:hypothetical protein AXF42_Ash002182 [Apostasia shenzhenica]